MKITTTKKTLDSVPKECVRVTFSEDEQNKYIEQKEGTTTLSLGAGKYKDINVRMFRTLCRTIVRTARAHKLERIAVDTAHMPFPHIHEKGVSWIVATMAENFVLANYEYTAYKKEKHELKEILLCGGQSAETARAFRRACMVAEEVNKCRDSANTPGGAMTPALLTEQAKKRVAGTKVKVTVFDKKRIEKEKMGALLGLQQGSKHGPRFIILEYWGAGKPAKKSIVSSGAFSRAGHAGKNAPIVFIGKGITFDS